MALLFRSAGVSGELIDLNLRMLRMVVDLHVMESVAQLVLLALLLAFGVALPVVHHWPRQPSCPRSRRFILSTRA